MRGRRSCRTPFVGFVLNPNPNTRVTQRMRKRRVTSDPIDVDASRPFLALPRRGGFLDGLLALPAFLFFKTALHPLTRSRRSARASARSAVNRHERNEERIGLSASGVIAGPACADDV